MAVVTECRGTIARWLPNDPDVTQKFQSKSLAQLNKNGLSLRAPVVVEDPGIFGDFHGMFKQVRPNPDPKRRLITNYIELLAVLSKTITVAPTYSYTSPLVSGVPMYGVLAPLMLFAQAWVCYPDLPYMDFTSWDDFFGRRFREGVRPTFAPDKPEFINAACEAITHRVSTNVKATDEFWLKEMPYSLNHILDCDPLTSEFVGGTVSQAMLSSLDYHRWHSPVDGRVVKTYTIPGTYCAARLDDDPDLDVISRSQAFVTAISTRALVFIESDKSDVGLMCFVGVGLGEISTTKVEVKEGDRVKKGDDIGSFHFGGSTYPLPFRPQTKTPRPAVDVVILVWPCDVTAPIWQEDLDFVTEAAKQRTSTQPLPLANRYSTFVAWGSGGGYCTLPRGTRTPVP